jgi:hypothetical protein
MRIEVIGCPEDAEATTWTGELDVAPEAGELTVTPANAAVVMRKRAARGSVHLVLVV